MATEIDLDGKLRLHSRFAASLSHVGRDQAPVLVVDNFLDNAELLVDFACTAGRFEGVSDTSYPGVRTPLPPIYLFAVKAFLGALIAESFGLHKSAIAGSFGYFSLVTREPGQLSVLQRMPHIDDTSPMRLAVLHYLCEAKHGGTSFYRQRSTGFESIDNSRAPRYRQAVVTDISRHGPPSYAYICGDDAQYERSGSFAAAFNRVLIYRSQVLHSADIDPGATFDADPRSGRLTANSFLIYA